MKPNHSPDRMMALIARETRWRLGPVPTGLGGKPASPGRWQIAQGRFLLRCESGLGYYYQPGEGITIERPVDADPDEELLWLKGTVHAAVACLNGLYPVHASAVAWEGRVHAFTGPAGAGKSTLVAGLGAAGLPLFCDDTLLLDLTDPGRIMCLPGHKRLKLLPDALTMSGARGEAPVGAETGKLYCRTAAGEVAMPLPLASLTFLEDGPVTAWHPVAGAERFARLEDDHYTQAIYLAAQRPERAALFALRARIAGMVTMARLVRPRSGEGFAHSVELARSHIVPTPGES